MNKLLKLSINKDIFEKIVFKNINFIEKEASNYWKNELLEIEFNKNEILYNVYKFDKIILTNGLGKEKPEITIELKNLVYDKNRGVFIFYFGKILEQKNISNISDDKDILIKKLLDEKNELLKMISDIKKSNI
jgi:hypothetical protein